MCFDNPLKVYLTNLTWFVLIQQTLNDVFTGTISLQITALGTNTKLKVKFYILGRFLINDRCVTSDITALPLLWEAEADLCP